MQVGFYFDQSRCIGCFNCVAACRSWNEMDPEIPDLIIILKQERGEFPDLSMTHLFLTCFHCTEPSCVQVCPEQILKKRSEDGIVIVSDPERCIRCELCVESCPYDAPKVLKNSAQNIVKCNLCIDRLEIGRPPACVSACPTEALDVRTVNELNAKYGELKKLDGFPDSSITGPAVIFRPMQRE
jgi:anaerobic dimethyl sulfoxide reductase subunit B (iron-sulfur subunit)